MIQIFLLGSSTVYGVGGTRGGWADRIKQALHEKMYGTDGAGEKYEVYNFGKSGATIDFVLDTFPQQLAAYGRGGKTIVIFNVGGNNMKAVDKPDNFVSTPEEYSAQMDELLQLLTTSVDHVIAVSSGYYDESKTNPKPNPLTGGVSYHTNKRAAQFKPHLESLCQQYKVPLVGPQVTQAEWLEKYCYTDGLHANDAGHEHMFKKIMAILKTLPTD